MFIRIYHKIYQWCTHLWAVFLILENRLCRWLHIDSCVTSARLVREYCDLCTASKARYTIAFTTEVVAKNCSNKFRWKISFNKAKQFWSQDLWNESWWFESTRAIYKGVLVPTTVVNYDVCSGRKTKIVIVSMSRTMHPKLLMLIIGGTLLK